MRRYWYIDPVAYDSWRSRAPEDEPEGEDYDIPGDEEEPEPTKSETDRAAREYEAYIHRDRT